MGTEIIITTATIVKGCIMNLLRRRWCLWFWLLESCSRCLFSATTPKSSSGWIFLLLVNVHFSLLAMESLTISNSSLFCMVTRGGDPWKMPKKWIQRKSWKRGNQIQAENPITFNTFYIKRGKIRPPKELGLCKQEIKRKCRIRQIIIDGNTGKYRENVRRMQETHHQQRKCTIVFGNS